MTTSAVAASSLAAPPTSAPAPSISRAVSATAEPFSAIQEPIVTRLPALASRSVRPNRSSPVPPMTAISMAGEPTLHRDGPVPHLRHRARGRARLRGHGRRDGSQPAPALVRARPRGRRRHGDRARDRRARDRVKGRGRSRTAPPRVVLAEHAAEHVGALAQGRPRAQGDPHGWEQVGGAAGRRLDLLERTIHRTLIARGSERPEPLDLPRDLLLTDRLDPEPIVLWVLARRPPAPPPRPRDLLLTDRLDPDRLLLGILEPVHPDDHAFAGLDPLLDPERGL